MDMHPLGRESDGNIGASSIVLADTETDSFDRNEEDETDLEIDADDDSTGTNSDVMCDGWGSADTFILM